MVMIRIANDQCNFPFFYLFLSLLCNLAHKTIHRHFSPTHFIAVVSSSSIYLRGKSGYRLFKKKSVEDESLGNRFAMVMYFCLALFIEELETRSIFHWNEQE